MRVSRAIDRHPDLFLVAMVLHFIFAAVALVVAYKLARRPR
jgi:hypothetical protein